MSIAGRVQFSVGASTVGSDDSTIDGTTDGFNEGSLEMTIEGVSEGMELANVARAVRIFVRTN